MLGREAGYTSLELLAVLILKQPQLPLLPWHTAGSQSASFPPGAQVLLCQAAFAAGQPQRVQMYGVIPPQLQES